MASTYKITLPENLKFKRDWAGDYICLNYELSAEWLQEVGATIEEVKVLASDLPPGTLVRVMGEDVTWYRIREGWINPRGSSTICPPTFLDSFNDMYGLEIHYDPRERGDEYSS